jgi:hypothetical protein
MAAAMQYRRLDRNYGSWALRYAFESEAAGELL